MEQFVLVPLSVYNSSNNPTIVTKHERPKDKPEQNPTYQEDTIKKGFNQHLTTSATQSFGVSSHQHQAVKFQHMNSRWDTDWCAVEGLCTAFEAQKHTHTRYLFYFT